MSTSWRKSLYVSGLCAALALGAGCAATDIAPVRDPIFRDIPKPQGFSLVAERSTAFNSGRLRLAKCEYQGRRDTESVRRFYENHMPQAAFELKQSTLDNGVYTLTFESEQEVCKLRIRPKGLGGTGVGLELSPLPDAPIQAAQDLPPPPLPGNRPVRRVPAN